jgi:hypothetical protein
MAICFISCAIGLNNSSNDPINILTGLDGHTADKFRPATHQNIMSSISSIGSSSGNNAAAIYQENLARAQAQKQAANASAQKAPTQSAPAPSVDVDHDGDRK